MLAAYQKEACDPYNVNRRYPFMNRNPEDMEGWQMRKRNGEHRDERGKRNRDKIV